MEFSHFVEWGFYGLISGAVVYGVGLLQKMSESIEQLNKGVAELVGKHAGVERELDSHNERITRLEDRVGEMK